MRTGLNSCLSLLLLVEEQLSTVPRYSGRFYTSKAVAAAIRSGMAGPEATSPSLVVRDGDTVIWDVNGDRQAFITLDPKWWVPVGALYMLGRCRELVASC